MKATRPGLGVTVPSESLNFGLCPVKEDSIIKFCITNSGEKAFNYSWDIMKPFSISPSKGSLLLDETASFVVKIHPMVR